MAKLIQIPYQSDIVVPVATAQSVQANRENPISLEALGLLVNLISYPSTWELHKTELYKRFGKNKESSVRSAWNDLIAANYIIEFKYRIGKKWEYVYYFRKVPFSPEEKAEILENAAIEYGGIWRLDFQDLKMKTSKSRDNKIPKENKNPKLNNKYDDDKRTSNEDSPLKENTERINLIISNLREATKEELRESSFKAVVRKVVDKYNQGEIKSSFRAYLVSALANKIAELEDRRAKEKGQKSKIDKHNLVKANEKRLNKQPIRKDVPMEDWFSIFSEVINE